MMSFIKVPISPGNSAYGDTVSTVAKCLHDQTLTVFTGAGISKPSGLPLSWTLIDGLVQAIHKAFDIVGLGTLSERNDACQVIKKYPLERILDALVGVHGDKALRYISEVLMNAAPNFNHHCLSELAKRGFIGDLVTLNFDLLFENALFARDVSFCWHLPLAATDRCIPDIPAQVTIHKLHGTLPFPGFPYFPHYLAATLRYAGDRPQAENVKVLEERARDRPNLLVAGYSDNDWDISPIITDMNWENVYWCEYVRPNDLKHEMNGKPCERIWNWLANRDESSTRLLCGDIRTLFGSILQKLGLTVDYGNEQAPNGEWIDEAGRRPDASRFVQSPGFTTLAAVRLLDGTDNELFRHLLPQIGSLSAFAAEGELRYSWMKAMAWYYHAHERKIRKGILIRRHILKKKRHIRPENNLEYLADLRSIYYGYISAAKRPMLNPRWLLDLRKAFSLHKLISLTAETITNKEDSNPWISREAQRHVALADYYLIDLLHNWGYFLMPFSNQLVKWFTRKVFGKIAGYYRESALRYPALDWEYFYLRHIEASLIAGERLELNVTRKKLLTIAEMLRRTGQNGHLAYSDVLLTLINPAKSESEFRKVAMLFFEPGGIATPTGKLRIRLFQRYFWPDTSTLFATLSDLFRYSKARQ